MQVGVNYPWFDYGWDFGLGPPAWRGGRQTPRWFDKVDEHLTHLHGLGISVVRWFILADGLTYGTLEKAPRPEGAAPADWRFDPPPLDTAIVDHFGELLERFASSSARLSRMQLIPVLIDFHFCEAGLRPIEVPDAANPLARRADPGWVKQGRADAVRDPAKRARFLDAVLDPLLRASVRRRDVIYAWELINEPDWVTRGWHPDPRANAPIPESAMREFLEDGKQRIRAAGFKPTIGFAMANTLQRSGVTAEINQFHYYPDGRTPLDRHAFDPRFPGIIGEFATSASDVWPDLTADGQGIADCLRLAESRGYPLVLPWSFLARDRHTEWSAAVERDVRSFMRPT